MFPDGTSPVALYFTTFAVLFLVYLFLRFAFEYDADVTYKSGRRYTFKDYIQGMRSFKCGPFRFDGKSIETRELNNRIQHVREELTQGKTPNRPVSFKRAIAVENKRTEIAKLAFFQPHPPVEAVPQEPADGLHLLLI